LYRTLLLHDTIHMSDSSRLATDKFDCLTIDGNNSKLKRTAQRAICFLDKSTPQCDTNVLRNSVSHYILSTSILLLIFNLDEFMMEIS